MIESQYLIGHNCYMASIKLPKLINQAMFYLLLANLLMFKYRNDLINQLGASQSQRAMFY